MWSSILDYLFPPREDEVALRDLSSETFVTLLAPRIVESTRPSTIALLHFTHPHVRPVLHEAKYHGSRKAFNLLAAALGEYLHDADVDLSKARLLPVPLGSKRQRERGYNQAEEIARRAASTFDIKIDTELLTRVRDTKSQVSLPRSEREENLLGAFQATGPIDPNLTYIVFDDVITTGATLQAAIDALMEAGATHIVPVAIAH